MKTSFARRAAAILGAFAIVAIAVAATRPPAKGVSYRLRMQARLPSIMQQLQNPAGQNPAVVARVKAVGKNARFDIDSGPQGSPVPVGDYMLFLETGRMIRVSPSEKVYDEAPNGFGAAGANPIGMLGSVAGRGGNGRQVEITGIDMDLQQLDDETLQGRQVRHYQLVAEFTVEAMNNMVPVRIEMETWTADLPPTQAIINPFDFVGTVSGTDPASKLTTRLLAERKKMQGTPLKTSMNFIITGLANGAVPPLEFGQTTEVLDIRSVDVDPKELDVPAGFTKREPRGRGRGGAP